MGKVILILVVATIIEACGVVFLSRGLKEIQGAREITVSEVARVVKMGVVNPSILLGVALEAVFFGVLLYLLSSQDVSFVWPMTSIGFIVTTLAAQLILHEKVGGLRWAGVLLITAGAFLTSYSEELGKRNAAPPQPPPLNLTSLGHQ